MSQDKPRQEKNGFSHEIKPGVTHYRPGSESSEKPAKRLMRARNQRVIAGVCGGLGKYFNTDPVWFRILFIILLFCVGFTLVVYLLMWLIMPLEP